ncbi:MAG: copper chaperone PCu(A)C [Deinococcus-Thermus bacterium]|nr:MULTISPECIES: copper chaperone PCu(A)C [Thermaceae]RMH53830.1 MAG: copper chaperone PCu(A)C [Deinococcota bacterium]
MPRTLIHAALLALGLTLAQAPVVRVQDPYVRLVPPTLKDTAAYMTLENLGTKPLRLVGGSTPAAAMVMPMRGVSEVRGGQEVKGMRPVEHLEIPPKGRLVLKPGGDHLMLVGLKAPLKEGQKIPLTLRFAGGLSQTLEPTVQAR